MSINLGPVLLTGMFLMLFVLLPSLAGIAVRGAAGKRRVESVKPALKTANAITLLLLNYSRAVSLPKAVTNPDPEFLLLTLVLVTALCAVAFTAGWLLARSQRVDRGQEAALMFGLGMNNNGTCLVLASATLADHPLVMAPTLVYKPGAAPRGGDGGPLEVLRTGGIGGVQFAHRFRGTGTGPPRRSDFSNA